MELYRIFCRITGSTWTEDEAGSFFRRVVKSMNGIKSFVERGGKEVQIVTTEALKAWAKKEIDADKLYQDSVVNIWQVET